MKSCVKLKFVQVHDLRQQVGRPDGAGRLGINDVAMSNTCTEQILHVIHTSCRVASLIMSEGCLRTKFTCNALSSGFLQYIWLLYSAATTSRTTGPDMPVGQFTAYGND